MNKGIFADGGWLDRKLDKYATRKLFNALLNDEDSVKYQVCVKSIQKLINSRNLNIGVDQFITKILNGQTMMDIYDELENNKHF